MGFWRLMKKITVYETNDTVLALFQFISFEERRGGRDNRWNANKIDRWNKSSFYNSTKWKKNAISPYSIHFSWPRKLLFQTEQKYNFYMNPQTTVKVRIFLSFIQPTPAASSLSCLAAEKLKIFIRCSPSPASCVRFSSSECLSFSHSAAQAIKLGNFHIEVYQISQISSIFSLLLLSVPSIWKISCLEFASQLCCSCLCYLIHNFIYSIFIHEIELLENIYDFLYMLSFSHIFYLWTDLGLWYLIRLEKRKLFSFAHVCGV